MADLHNAKLVENSVIEALAEVRRKSPEQIRKNIDNNGGDVDVHAKEAMAIVASVEEKLGLDETLSPSDFAGGTANGTKNSTSNGCMDPADGTTLKDVINKIISKISPTS